MPPKAEDITGRKFGEVVVLRQVPHKKGRSTRWEVQCSCGNIYETDYGTMKYALKTYGTYACMECKYKRSKANYDVLSPEYTAWGNMQDRCYNPNYVGFHRYGGRGITVCDRWLESFENFLADMGPKPSSGHSLDRVNDEGNYCPENCRWATTVEQGRNTTNNINVTYNGETKCIIEWSETLDINYATLLARYHQGLRGDSLFAPPRDALTSAEGPNGVIKTIWDWAKDTGIGYQTLYSRHAKGFTGAALVAEPLMRSILVKFNGATRPLKEWADHFELDYEMLRKRYHKGERGDRLFRPSKRSAKQRS